MKSTTFSRFTSAVSLHSDSAQPHSESLLAHSRTISPALFRCRAQRELIAQHMNKPTIAVLRPDDHRIAEAVEYLWSLAVSPVADPMLTIRPTGQMPTTADYCVFTSKTGVEIVAKQDWDPDESTVVQSASRPQPHYEIMVLQLTLFRQPSRPQVSLKNSLPRSKDRLSKLLAVRMAVTYFSRGWRPPMQTSMKRSCID